MAESQSENNQNIGSCHSCENERQTEETLSNQFEFVELKAVEGDISDISEEERQAGSATKPQRDRPKKKVKKKRKRSKSFTSNDEVSSSDDDTLKTVVAQRKSPQNVDLSNLNWSLWLWYYIVAVSTGAFHFAEYLGEKLADFFGITSPKYQYVIDEYYRMKQEEEEERKQAEREEEFVQKREAEKLSQLEGGDEQEQELKC